MRSRFLQSHRGWNNWYFLEIELFDGIQRPMQIIVPKNTVKKL